MTVAASKNPAKEPRLEAMATARVDDATLRLRSGSAAPVLRDAAVAIVGAGAIGSFLADLLVRAGVGALTLIDGDRVRPGNSVRHLAGQRYWGWNKAEAVADIVRHAHGVAPSAQTTSLTAPADAELLLEAHDLVIDATANTWTGELISRAAEHGCRPALSVYLQRDGGVARVDRWPLVAWERPQAPVPVLPGRYQPERREGGCGDPVSLTPAWAAITAATRASHLASQILLGERVPVTVVDVLEPQPDPPYEQLGVVA